MSSICLRRRVQGTVPAGQVVFTSSQNWTVPDGVSKIDIFCAGATGGNGGSGTYNSMNTNPAGGGSNRYYSYGGGTPGGGYTKTFKNISVAPGSAHLITIGAVGGNGDTWHYQAWSDGMGGGGSEQLGNAYSMSQITDGKNGGASYFGTSYNASGGEYGRKATASKGGRGGNGGSGGGGGGWSDVDASWTPSGSYTDRGQGQFSAGANGTDGGSASYGTDYRVGEPGTGQGTTTRAFGESNGTIYGGPGQSGIVIIRWAEQ